VVDAGYHRILIFPSYDQWPAQLTSFRPAPSPWWATIPIHQNLGERCRPSATFFLRLRPACSIRRWPRPLQWRTFPWPIPRTTACWHALQTSSTQPTFAAATGAGAGPRDTGSINLIEGKELQLSYYDQSNTVQRIAALRSTTPATRRTFMSPTRATTGCWATGYAQGGPGAGSVGTSSSASRTARRRCANYPTGDPAQPTTPAFAARWVCWWIPGQSVGGGPGKRARAAVPGAVFADGQPVADLVWAVFVHTRSPTRRPAPWPRLTGWPLP